MKFSIQANGSYGIGFRFVYMNHTCSTNIILFLPGFMRVVMMQLNCEINAHLLFCAFEYNPYR